MKNEVENNFFREKPKLLVQLKSATTFGAISSSPIILDWNRSRSGTFPLTCTVAVLLTRNSLTRPHMAHIAHTRTPLSSPSLGKCTRTSTVSFCNKTQDSGTAPWPNTPFCVPFVYTSRDLTWLTWQRKCQNRVSLSRIANLLLTPLTPFVSRAQFRPGSNLFSDPHSAPSE